MDTDREDWGALESLYLKGEQLTATDREVLLQEHSANEHLRSRLWALWRQGDRTESFLAAPVLSNFTAFTDGRNGAAGRRYQPGQAVANRFEIHQFLGEGGMGSVYRAQDKTLGREVALKILQWSGVGEEIRLRADREAHLISALNHPGICTLHDIYWDRTTPILVMECLQGETLAQRLTRSPLTVEEFRTIGIQICEALTYAHDRRVLHGDLKPANIMLTERGAVLLDFGLARSIGEPAAGAHGDEPPASPTVPAGWVAGTPGYMSPEQIRGQPLDARSDVFSLGCVLYKMASGKSPFHRKSTEDTFKAILNAAPEPPVSQLSGVSKQVRLLIAKCLELDPAARFASVSEVSEGLRRAASSRPRARLIWAGAGILLLIAVAVSELVMRTRSPQGLRSSPQLRQLTFEGGSAREPAISQDGKLVAYAADRDGTFNIYAQEIDKGTPVQLTHSSYDQSDPVFSADGKQIVYHSAEDNALYVIPTSGGTSRLLASNAYHPRVSPDGALVAYVASNPQPGVFSELRVIAFQGGRSTLLSQAMGSNFGIFGYPAWLPDGASVAAFAGTDSEQDGDVWLFRVNDSSAAKSGLFGQLGDDFRRRCMSAAFVYRGNLYATLMGNTTELWRIPIKERLMLAGSPEKAVNTTDGQRTGAASKSGRLVFDSRSTNYDLYSFPIDARHAVLTGDPKRLTFDVLIEQNGSVSDDGNTLAYVVVQGSNFILHVRDLLTGEDRALGRVYGFGSSLSHGGKLVLYSTPNRDLVVMNWKDGTRKLLAKNVASQEWSADDRRVAFATAEKEAFVIELASGTKSEIVQPEGIRGCATFAPNEKLLACATPSVTEPREFVIVPYGLGMRKQRTTVVSGSEVPLVYSWSPASDIFYWVAGEHNQPQIRALRVDPLTGQANGSPFTVAKIAGPLRTSLPYTTGFEIRANQVILTLAETKGNIWMTELN